MGHRIRIWADKDWFYLEILGPEVGPISVTCTVHWKPIPAMRTGFPVMKTGFSLWEDGFAVYNLQIKPPDVVVLVCFGVFGNNWGKNMFYSDFAKNRFENLYFLFQDECQSIIMN